MERLFDIQLVYASILGGCSLIHQNPIIAIDSTTQNLTQKMNLCLVYILI